MARLKTKMSATDNRHDNLLSLLNHLHLMENSLTNFMLETVLKLQSLTSEKVFLLLESPQSQRRRYCGSKELIDAFEGDKGLVHEPFDIAVELDSNTGSLIEKKTAKRKKHGAERFATEQTIALTPVPADSNLNSSMLTWATEDAVAVPAATEDARAEASPSKKRRFEDDNAAALSSSTHLDFVDLDLKEEISKTVPEYVISDDDNDDGVDEDRNSSFPLADYAVAAENSAAAAVVENSLTLHAEQLLDPHSFFDALENPPLERSKYQALLSIPNALAAYEKGTMENRLLKSVCYNVGKNAALKCPYRFSSSNKEAVHAYWSHHCDLFVGQAGNSGLLVDKSHFNDSSSIRLDCLKRTTAVGFIRQSIRDGFKKVANKHQIKE